MFDKTEIQFPFEPFRVKDIEKIKITTKEERKKIIENAHYNLFLIKAEDVMIDLLTDSSTGAMSSEQSASLITGDESYAGSKSFFMFENAVRNLTNFKFIFPVHQGRAAERIPSGILCAPGKIVLSNGLFDTTRANIENL
jgi:tyrosine phenol-lyase